MSISRRSFLKGSVVAAGATLASAAMTAGALAEAAEEKKVPSVPGTAGVVDRAALPVKAWDDPTLNLRIRWSGVNFYEMVLPNGKTIVMDPYYDTDTTGHNEFNYTPTDLPAGEWVNGGDYVVLTHGHFDHTEQLYSVLEHYPDAHVLAPEHALPSIVWNQVKKVNYAGHYFDAAGAHDKFEYDGFVIETCRSNHNCSKYPKADELDPAKYLDEDGKLDFFRFFNWIYEREIMNMKITTEDGFTILIWNSEMQPDGMGFETRRYFYRDANPDLIMYQTAGASFNYDRRNPEYKHMGEWLASIKGRVGMPEHQQHFSYEELDAMGAAMAEYCNAAGVGTQFHTPETGVWYGLTKEADGTVSVCLVDKK